MIATPKVYRRARVYNDHTDVFDQTVNGTRYRIEPKKFIELPRREAVRVRGHFCGDGVVTRLRIEPVKEKSEPSKETFVCPLTDKKFDSKKDYDKHVEELRKRLN